jgi:hypothetical protein
MQIEVTLKREPVADGTSIRLYLRSNHSIISGFPDTEAGMEEARRVYNETLKLVRATGNPTETILKEVIVFPDSPTEEKGK